ncbi:MAG TPA: CRISPR-associated ring nuclease [Anaerolineaceae bacterium]|nr:CRISPR-associated ring nuclease [Anaerolineaceae bacterium]HPN53848.1 CRISPR-associated ring nuclease [Anaerolineaceae bacterium]
MSEIKTSYVATLGGQPQIITFTLDLLLARNESIDQVVVIYLAGNPRYQDSFKRLQAEFPQGQYHGRPCRLHAVPVLAGKEPIADAYEPTQIEAVRAAFHRLLHDLKQMPQAVHLGLSSGRRIMSLVGLAAAMQFLSPTDHIWHIYTPDSVAKKVKEEQLMHVPADSGVRLIEVPFVAWPAYFPGLAPLFQQSTAQMIRSRLHWLSDEDRSRCRRVWEKLTPRQRETLTLMAKGADRNEMAQHMNISLATVDSHREAALKCAEEIWGEDDLVFNARFWIEKFDQFIVEMST